MTSNALLRKTLETLPLRESRIAIFEEACAGGSGRHVADLASNLISHGHDVHLLYSSTHIDDQFRRGIADLRKSGGHATVINLHHGAHPSDFKAVAAVRSYLRREGPFDIFHCHSTKAGLVGRLAAFKLGIPVLYTPHAFLTMSPVCDRMYSAGAYIVERTLSRITDVIICVSEEEIDHALNLGIPQNKLKLIPNGMLMRDAHECRSVRAVVRRELSLSDTDICIGAVGRLVEQKSPDVLVEAFGLAARKMDSNVKLVLVGAGPLLPKLESLAKAFSVQDRVTFTGRLPGLRTMAAFDIFALSSCYEGHPYAFIEALGLGLPIVTTAVGGAKMSVLNGINGFISPVGNPEAMARSLVALAQSSSTRERMSYASFKAAGDFTLEKMISRTNQLYLEKMQRPNCLVKTAVSAS